ncbi:MULTISPECIES: hypothetical protein [unclassified Streptomyces]|uniref:hypothetical protein n=1 Tax=unclassified Streptomyces TaxID=2593676 RepID=UPI0034246BB1
MNDEPGAQDPGTALHYDEEQLAAPVSLTALINQGVIHDFVMLSALRETRAAQAAITQAIDVLRTAPVLPAVR